MNFKEVQTFWEKYEKFSKIYLYLILTTVSYYLNNVAATLTLGVSHVIHKKYHIIYIL
jgi:hypothetical protein